MAFVPLLAEPGLGTTKLPPPAKEGGRGLDNAEAKMKAAPVFRLTHRSSVLEGSLHAIDDEKFAGPLAGVSRWAAGVPSRNVARAGLVGCKSRSEQWEPAWPVKAISQFVAERAMKNFVNARQGDLHGPQMAVAKCKAAYATSYSHAFSRIGARSDSLL
jgi:hypothetical protein